VLTGALQSQYRCVLDAGAPIRDERHELRY
jgi:hypothetical protein